MSRFISRLNLTLAAITALAAFFRVYRLDEIPPGFHFDQAFYVFDSLRLLQGEFAIFFHEPGRSEPLYQYLLMVGVALWGSDTPMGLRLTGATIGVLTIPMIYGLTRTIFQSARIALLAALFAAISFWHIFYCRYGERIPLTVLMTGLTFWFFWRALDRARLREFAFAGLFTGVTLYTYPSSRIVPIALVLLTAYAMATDRPHAHTYLKGLALAGAIAVAIFLPLGSYYLLHPNDFVSHAAEVSIFLPHGEIEGDVPSALAQNGLRLLGMFFIVGDSGSLRNLPYRPIFDPLVGALFVVGVIVWLGALLAPRSTPVNRRRAVFLAVWLGLALLLSLISDDAPNNGRVLIGMPVVMILPAWGASELWNWLSRITAGYRRTLAIQRMALFALGAIVITSMALTFRDYFILFAKLPELYYVFDVDKLEVSAWINQHARDHTVFLAPLWAQQGTISLLTRNAPLKSFESRDTIILPNASSGKDAFYAFPPEQEKKVQTLATRLGSLGGREDLIGSNGAKILLVYRVPAKNLPEPENPLPALARGHTLPPTMTSDSGEFSQQGDGERNSDFIKPQKTERAVWNDQIELFGYTVDAADSARRNLEVTLFFRALKPMIEDYTFSVKVRDETDRVWGQEDKWAGDNSYATGQWAAGDVVIERFYPGLNACAPAGNYRMTVEAYNPKTRQVLTLMDSDGGAAALGTWQADVSPSNRLEHLEPEQTLDLQIAPEARLMGLTLTPKEAHSGDPFSLSLFWRGVGDGTTTRHISIRVGNMLLAEKSITLPPDGRGFCTFFDFQLPRDIAQGESPILVNEVRISTLKIVR